MRNLGGSIGIAVLATYLTVREHYHFSVVSERLTQNSLKVAEWTGTMSRYFAGQGAGPDAAHQQPLAQMQAIVRREAFVMAYSDCFFLIGVALLVSVLALFLIPKPKTQAGAGAAH
jgi:DHA2 family multidrug resistance protein